MDGRQLVCYPRSGTFLPRNSVCCVPVTFFLSKSSLQSPNRDQNMPNCQNTAFELCSHEIQDDDFFY